MTKQELTDYCFMYWQHISKKMFNLMKDYPCVYIDNRILIHSLTYGKDTDAPCNHDIYSVTHGRDEYVAHLQDDRELGNGCAEAQGQGVAHRS